MRFDPWRDAAAIAARLQAPGTRLVLGLGAEDCVKCALFAPLFETLAEKEADGTVWVWMWQQEHAEFLGGLYVPDPPLVCVFEGARLRSAGWPDLEVGHRSAVSLLGSLTSAPGIDAAAGQIRQRLLRVDWAR